MTEIRSAAQPEKDVGNTAGPLPRHTISSTTYGEIVMSVSVVTEFVRWNEEAVQRCILVTPQVSHDVGL
jgi:hypothetical protein